MLRRPRSTKESDVEPLECHPAGCFRPCQARPGAPEAGQGDRQGQDVRQGPERPLLNSAPR